MAAWRSLKNIDILTKLLIKAVTGFEEEDENFDLSYQYVTSNIKYHKFLDVDSHKITRNINGIYDKFRIHCQDEKATEFRRLCDDFLSRPVYEDRDHGHTDTHFAVLSLLLQLSNNPTNAKYQLPAKSKKQQAIEQFDWAAYLREGEESVPRHFVDSPEISDDEDDITFHADARSTVKQENVETLVDSSETVAYQPAFQNPEIVSAQASLSDDWLRHNVVVQFWRGVSEVDRPDAAPLRSQIAIDWDAYLMRTNVLYTPSSKTIITEYHIAREIIWMLCGARDLTVFLWSGSEFVPNTNVRVLHLTDDALQVVLARVVMHGNTVQRLRSFIDSVMAPDNTDVELGLDSGAAASRTYQAFAAVLSDCLQRMSRSLVDFEKKICKQEDTMTLAVALDGLSSHFSELVVLGKIFVDGITTHRHVTSASRKASCLLAEIFRTLTDLNGLGDDSDSLVSLVLLIWLRTSRPYIEIIDGWISRGRLNDPRKEFVIQRNEAIQAGGENFWSEAFTLSCVESESPSTNSTSTEDGIDEPAAYSPSFLQPVLKDIIVAGKSMELLVSLGYSSDVVRTVTQGRQSSLYEAYVSDICSQFYVTSRDEAQRSTPPQQLRSLESREVIERVENLLRQSATYDPLLEMNFRQVLDNGSDNSQQPNNTDISLDCCVSQHAAVNALQTLHSTLRSCLLEHVTVRCSVVNKQLLRILSTKYQLLDYFTAIGQFYLMEAGSAMFEFYTTVFDKISAHELWQDVSFLNDALHDALHAEFRSDVERMYVSVDAEKCKTASESSLNALDCVSLQYKVPWPVDIILNSRCMAFYNQVFRFLLQIKRVKYSLDGLKFSDLRDTVVSCQQQTDADPLRSVASRALTGVADASSSSDPVESLVHRTLIFRMRLLHFTNSLHDYVMTRILHSVGLEFQVSLAAARDLDEVIDAHRTYISAIRERCLLHPKVAFIRDMICRVLNLALTLHLLWNKTTFGRLSHAKLEQMECDFSRCIQFLAAMIKKVTARGTFPHLESLAFSLVTCSQIPQPARK